MIVFHEGLPRSGKSYSVFADWIGPALSKGRKCFAYIEGISHVHVAEATGLDRVRVEELLIPVAREDVKRIHELVEKDALVVIDEAQNFWPTTRQPLDEKTTRFVTEHGHDGHDIVLMGQNLMDVHNLWKRRVEQKVVFEKLSALGKPDSYRATIYRRVDTGSDKIKFEKVTSSSQEYDPKWFGCYKSHTDGTTNKQTLVDKRSVIWNHPFFKKWLPIYGVILVAAIGVIVWAFSGGIAGSAPPKVAAKKVVASSGPGKVEPKGQGASAPGGLVRQEVAAPSGHVAALSPVAPADYVDQLNSQYRPRLGGFISAHGRMVGLVEWRDTDGGVRERLTFGDLGGMGWLVLVSPDGHIATMQRGEHRVVLTSWPLEDDRGRVPSPTQAKIRELQDGTS